MLAWMGIRLSLEALPVGSSATGVVLGSQGPQSYTALCTAPFCTLSPRTSAPPVFAKSKTKGPADANGSREASITAGRVSQGSHLSACTGSAGTSPSPALVYRGGGVPSFSTGRADVATGLSESSHLTFWRG